jgi:hypothetical protein
MRQHVSNAAQREEASELHHLVDVLDSEILPSALWQGIEDNVLPRHGEG